jgi:hypothetical protein
MLCPYEWYVPSSVVNAFWGDVMARIAALQWLSDLEYDNKLLPDKKLEWPPVDDIDPETLWKDLSDKGDMSKWVLAYPLWGRKSGNLTFTPLKDWWHALERISFLKEGSDSTGTGEYDTYSKAIHKPHIRFGSLHRNAHAVLEYYSAATMADATQAERDKVVKDELDGKKIMRVRVIRSYEYDFILYPGGLDLFLGPTPFPKEGGKPVDKAPTARKKALKNMLQMYKHRKTGSRPIALPGLPATAKDDKGGCLHIPVRTPAGPTGASQASQVWLEGMLNQNSNPPAWWLTGNVYRGIMTALPRIIASMWHEQEVWDVPVDTKNKGTYTWRYQHGGLKRLLEERLEQKLPVDLEIEVTQPPGSASWSGWNRRDVMITDKGLVLPQEIDSPKLEPVLEDIIKGDAGNPVFTSSDVCM